jgi:hypothetical protein
MLQEASQEPWGQAPRGSDFRTVQGYRRPLRDSERGIEFYTEVRPTLDDPTWVSWREGMPGVRIDGDWARIDVVITRNTQKERR